MGEPSRPNIVFVFSDNLGFGELGVYGGGLLRGAPTPRLDALAGQGMRLLNMNMESQCTPSRSAVMTGRFPLRSGTCRITQPQEPGGLVRWERTLAEVLSEAGYATGHFGKWHLGNMPGRYPNDRGFDRWWGIDETHDTSLWFDSPEFDPTLIEPTWLMEGRKGEPTRRIRPYGRAERALFDAECFSRATEFIREHAHRQPFFCYLPIAFPHFPIIPHDEFKGCTGHGDFADGLVELDTRVGRLLDELDALGIAEDTLVIFTSDNGVEETLPSRGWTGPWGGSYFTAMEGCLRVPFIARWPGRIAPGGISNEVVHAVDIFSTLCTIGGGEIPDDRPIDGIDISGLLTGASTSSGREGFPVYVRETLHAVKWRHWKMHFIWQEYMYDPPQILPIPRLFNLHEDPRERHDVFLPANTWVKVPIGRLRQAWQRSLEEFPPIAAGTPDPYRPPA
ncbi:MAG: sulfatase-like hydrolase/transferase [Burkholderiaceae bacterium]